MSPRVSLTAALLTALALTGGCARIKDNQGYLVDEQLLASIQPGIDNKESVAKTLGRPSFAGQYKDDHWYYVSRNTTQLAFMAPRPKTQSILMVVFDGAGHVTKVQRSGLEKVVDITPVKDKTKTRGRDSSLFEDLFGNIGSFGAAGTGGSSGPGGVQAAVTRSTLPLAGGCFGANRCLTSKALSISGPALRRYAGGRGEDLS